VGPEATRAALRALFADWGLPGALRVANGTPWGAPGDRPTDPALWLSGLWVAVRRQRPRHRRENGRVGRTHGVPGTWAEPATCAAAAALQTALTDACRCRREHDPASRGQTRATAFPAPMAGGRPFAPAREGAHVDEPRGRASL